MVPTLSDYLKDNPGRGFRSAPQYFPTGDFLTYFLKDVPHYAERLDEVLTVYLDAATKELVGLKVKGVRHILKAAGELGLVGLDDPVRLATFIFAAAGADRTAWKSERYAQLVALKDVSVSRKDLPAVCA